MFGEVVRMNGMREFFVLPVAVIAAYVRPWNEFWNATIHSRPVATRAIFIAFSTASAPLLAKTLFVATDVPSARGKMRSSSWARRT